MAKDAVLLTVFNRPPAVLINTLHGLLRNDLAETSVIVIDDGSTIDYSGVKGFLDGDGAKSVEWIRIDTVKERQGTYHVDGCNNPAYAFNRALRKARSLDAKRIFVMSSDCIVPAHALEHFRGWVDRDFVPFARTVDQDTQAEYCSSRRIWPLYWLMGAKTEWLDAIGGWDEEYLKGIAFEDNDFSARLFDQVKKFVIDDAVTVIHQSHPRNEYSDDLRGFMTNQRYTIDKWGANPWERNGEGLAYNLRAVRPGLTAVFHPTVEFPDRRPEKAAEEATA